MKRQTRMCAIPLHYADTKFWPYVEKSDGCWTWKGSKVPSGYGFLRIYGTDRTPELRESAHRFSFRLHKDELAVGLFCCHTCDNPACVRPDHLFSGTARDNSQDALRKGRLISPLKPTTHCKNGHEWTAENTYTQSNGRRGCRPCQLERQRRWKRLHQGPRRSDHDFTEEELVQ